jgi:hypothetical protein
VEVGYELTSGLFGEIKELVFVSSKNKFLFCTSILIVTPLTPLTPLSKDKGRGFITIVIAQMDKP